MKKILTMCCLIVSSVSAFSQKATMTWGDEFKMHKFSSDLAVIYSDNTGVYLKESHNVERFSFTDSRGESASLVKLDKNLTELYSNDFNKELKGKEFKQFFILQDKFYLLATDYDKKTRELTLYGAAVDKATGALEGDWQSITSWQKEEKKDDINFKVNYNADSSKMILVSSVEGKEKNTYEIRSFDKSFRQTDEPIVISNEFDPKTFQLEDVLYTLDGNIVLVGRVYAYEDGKKKKDKFLDFNNYNVRIYNNKGEVIKEVNTDINGKWLVSTKVVQEKDRDLVLAAFYSDTKKGKEINGLLVQRINPKTGEVITTSQKEINTSLITTVESDDGDDDNSDKEEQKEQEKLENIKDESEGFSKYMQFRGIYYTPDNGLVIVAEKYHHYIQTDNSFQSNFGGMGPATTGYGIGAMGHNSSSTFYVYECGDIMMSKVDVAGNINWLEILPKNQKEVIEAGQSQTAGTDSYAPSVEMGSGYATVGSSYFDDFNLPFYSGIGVITGNNTLNIIFNDNAKNIDVLQLGQKLKSATNFRKSDCYMVTLDEITGQYKRQSLFSNNGIPTAMPRLGAVIGGGEDMYIVGKNDRTLGKTKIAVGLLSVRD